MVTNRFVNGLLAGVAVSATGFYVYNRNREKIDSFLRSQGINVPATSSKDYANMSMEELVTTKEHIEDLIAEMESHRNNPDQISSSS
ncbi:MAG: hypothetical protein ACLFV2_11660 [Desulfurivibrionaceae bacterium]